MGLQYYMTEAVMHANIYEDGGIECYRQIPYEFHIICCSIGAIIHFLFMFYWGHTLSNPQEQKTIIKSNILEKIVGFSAFLAFILTFYYKFTTLKGMFIFNPCHISVFVMAILLLASSTPLMRKMHTCWTVWIFGAYLALATPHLKGISTFQVYLYYYQHLLLVPLGPIILKRRYGFLKPTFWNQLAAFSSLTLYQLLILTPLSRLSKVNLNFTLCHSHADFIYDYIGYHYFTAAIIYLNFFSFLNRCITYLMLGAISKIVAFMRSTKKKYTKYE